MQAGQQRRPQHGVLLRQRIGDRRRLGPRGAEGQRRVAFDEGERHRFREAARRQHLPHRTLARDVRRGRGLRYLQRREGGRDPIESEMAADFLDEVRLARHVHAEAGHDNRPAAAGRRHLEAERRQDPRHLVRRHLLAQQPGNALRAELDHGARPRRGIAVDHRPGGPAGANLLEQRRRARDAGRRRLDVAAALEPDRRFGLEAETLARAPDGGWMEAGALQHHPRRRPVDLRVAAPHHAGHRGRAPAVGNHEHVGIERAVDAVERAQDFAGRGAPDHEAAAVEPPHVERVHRLADLQHHVVRHVDDVVDGADAGGLEAGGQPGGGGADLHIEQLRAVARAEIRVAEIHLHRVAAAGGGGRGLRLQRRAPDDGGLAREAGVAQRVGPVRGDLEVDDAVRRGLDAGHLEPAQPDLGGHHLDVGGHLDEVRQPFMHDLHGRNCSRKRRSFS